VQAQTCSVEDSIAAGSIPPYIESWEMLKQAYSSYKHCDDGYIAEGYSDTVVQILAKNWASVGTLNTIGVTDPEFLKFVLRHIDATTDTTQLKVITVQAKEHCPTQVNSLCSAILKASNAALSEQ
jgi:hypothetical protein